MKKRKIKIETLKKAIDDGIESGIFLDFDPKAHLQKLKKERKVGRDSGQ